MLPDESSLIFCAVTQAKAVEAVAALMVSPGATEGMGMMIREWLCVYDITEHKIRNKGGTLSKHPSSIREKRTSKTRRDNGDIEFSVGEQVVWPLYHHP